MKLRKLGHSDLMVSEVSLGCMSLHSPVQKQASDIIYKAYDCGINFFDTADLYDHGMNEKAVGEAVHGFRNDIILSSKVGNQWRADQQGWDWKASKKYILKAIDATLNRLQTDYLDLYQLHGGTIEDPMEEIIEAFDSLVQAGKIRYYGISSIRPNVIKILREQSQITSVMMQYNLLDRRAEEQVLADLEEAGIGVLARGPIAKGLLVDKPAEAYLQYTSSEVQHLQRNVQEFAKRNEISNLATALSYILSHSAITTAVLGIRSAQQMNEFIKVKEELYQLSDSERQELVNGARILVYNEHR